MTIEFKAHEIEVIIDDDEELTSLFVSSLDPTLYFCVARDPDRPALYCEYIDQSNGFYSKILSSRWDEGCVEFQLKDDESFSISENLKKIRIFITEQQEEVKNCLNHLFDQ
jgi:hypothetical protein